MGGKGGHGEGVTERSNKKKPMHGVNLPGMFLKTLHTRNDDDFVDRLNHYYTAVMLMCFAILVTTKQYVGDAIQCWVPATFTDAMEQYTENYCWVKNTYKLSFSDHIPQSYYLREEREIGYYQWVPFILSIQALLFYFPCLFWRGLLYCQSHINLTGIVQIAKERQFMDQNHRTRTLGTISRHIEDRFRASIFARFPAICNVRLTITYLMSKLMYGANAIAQLVILSRFLGAKGILFGYYIIRDLLMEEEWEDISMFPRVTLCDFDVRVLGNTHRHTVQCVLMINMFNEKIFLFLWYWFLIIALLTTFNFLYWVTLMFWPKSDYEFIRRCLQMFMDVKSSKTSTQSSAMIHKFTDDYLHTDGVFMLRILSLHAGELATAEVVNQLWQSFYETVMDHTMIGQA